MLTVLFTICMIWFVGKYDYFLSSDIDRNGSRRINVYSFSAIDHWWDYRTCNVTFIKSQRGVFDGI